MGLDHCLYSARRQNDDFWVVQMRWDGKPWLDPHNPSTEFIPLDCVCAYRIYVDAIRGNATCAMCGRLYFKTLDGHDSCNDFLEF